MKKLYFTFFSLLIGGSLLALPIGNPSEANLLTNGVVWGCDHCSTCCSNPHINSCLYWCDAVDFRVGFYGDYVFNRHLEVDESGFRADIEESELATNAGYIVANFWDRYDFFVTMGATHLAMESNISSFQVPVPSLLGLLFPTERLHIEAETHFSWSVGGRATLWERDCTTLGIEGQFFSTHPNVRRITSGAINSLYPSNIQMKYHEWQVGLGLSHRIYEMFVPYIGVKWAHAFADFGNVTATLPQNPALALLAGPDIILLRDIESKKNWGYAIGLTVVGCSTIDVTVEGRWGDEKALYVNGQVRF